MPGWKAQGQFWSRFRRLPRLPRLAPRAARSAGILARLSMVLAVLEAHCGVKFGMHDVYLNVAGGYRIKEPAADLAVAAALVSSLAGLALPADCVYFGEISLSGAVRPVAHAVHRLKEAEKLGFKKAVIPAGGAELPRDRNVTTQELPSLAELVVKIISELKGKRPAIRN